MARRIVSGLYIVTLSNEEPIPVNRGERRLEDKCAVVTKVNCKFGKAKDFASRKRGYEGVFGVENVTFTPLFELNEIEKAEKAVLDKLKKWRKRNDKSGRMTEWLEGIDAATVEREAISVLSSHNIPYKQIGSVIANALEQIESKFNSTFADWNIRLPAENLECRRRGKIIQAGWAIWYLFDRDDNGEYLDYYASHRMTDDAHIRIYADGTEQRLPAISSWRKCSRNPGEDERLELEFRKKNREIAEMLNQKGFALEREEPGGVVIARYLNT